MGRARTRAAAHGRLSLSTVLAVPCALWTAACRWSWALTAAIVTTAGAAADLPTRPRTTAPCTNFLDQIREEFLGLAFHTLGRFAATADFHVQVQVDRFAAIIARDLVEGLLQLAEAGYLCLCHLSHCGSCFSEVSDSGLVGDIGLQETYGMLIQRLRSFIALYDEKLHNSSPLSTTHKEHVQAIHTVLAKSQHEGVPSELHELVLKMDLTAEPAGMNDETIEDIIVLAAGFRKLLASLHGAVIESLNLLALLVYESRLEPEVGTLLASPSALSYVKSAAGDGREDKNENATSMWPWMVQLAQGQVRPAMPFMRKSVLCDAPGEALYRQGSLPGVFDDVKPFQDSSGAYTWHSVPARSLLEALHHAGHRPSYTYWSVLPKGMYQPSIPCDEAVGMLYDPTACLEEAGWGGRLFFLSVVQASKHSEELGGDGDDPSPPKLEYKASVQRRHRPQSAQGGGAPGAEHSSRLEPTSWPPEPARDPVDVLFLHPMAGNCALLPELLASRGSPVRLLYVPINPALPPPLRAAPDFLRHWAGHLLWAKEAFRESGAQVEELVYRSMSQHFLAQCSLAQAAELLGPRGFELLHVEHFYAVFAQRLVAEPLRRRGSRETQGVHEGGLHRLLGPLFEAWRLGWFCSPVSRYALSLEELAQMDPAWLGVQDDASAAGAVCTFLARQGLEPSALMPRDACKQPEAEPHQEAPPGGRPSRWAAALALRQRMQWALELRDPLPGVSRHLGQAHTSETGHAGAQPRGLCRGMACECFAPYRGARCDEEDPGFHSTSEVSPFSAAIHYIVNDEPVHIAELLHALRNLWRRFNSRYDYPVLIFHDGLSSEVRIQIALAAPHRIWFHHVPEDFMPSPGALPPDLMEEDEKGEFSHHSFSVGYRAQSRFRAGPVFAHPAVLRLDYLWSLDTDSMFPVDLKYDPFEVMHKNESLVLGYEYITVTSGTSSKNFWEATLPYIGYAGIDAVAAASNRALFLRTFLMLSLQWEAAPIWNNKVVMTDCELLRVSFFRPGTKYFEYFEYLDTLQGFWLYRWGDHAVRGLGTAIALALHNATSDVSGSSRLHAYELQIPYAHQGSCFCKDPSLKCAKLGVKASGEPLWPPKKSIWECQRNGTGDAPPI